MFTHIPPADSHCAVRANRRQSDRRIKRSKQRAVNRTIKRVFIDAKQRKP